MNDSLNQVLEMLLKAVESVNASDCNTTDSVCELAKQGLIPVGISNRHVHLSKQDVETLFGPGYELTCIKDISQPGQFACKETVTLCGPKGVIEKVRVLGPVRSQSQIEILSGDGFKLGCKACLLYTSPSPRD